MSFQPRVSILPLSLILLLTIGLAESAPAQSQLDKQSAWHQLLLLDNQDLHKLEASDLDTVNSLANALIPKRDETQGDLLSGGDVRLRFVWELSSPTTGVVLFDSPMDFMSPGQQIHYLYFFDQTGQPLGSSKFSSGWRMQVTEAKLEHRDSLSLLVLATFGAGGFAYSQMLKECYALLGDRAVLVRLEEKNGLGRNSYGCPYPAVGPPVPKRTANQWISALSSGDQVEILQALMWIGGRHPNIEDLKQEQEDEESLRKEYPADSKMETTLERCPSVVDAAELFSEAIARKDLPIKLKMLAQSDNQWIREAAELASQQVTEQRQSVPKAP